MAAKLATALAVALVVLGASSLPPTSAHASLYKETFPFPSPNANNLTQDQALRAPPVNWCGGNAGDQFCNNPQQPGAQSPNQGGEGAISNSGLGPDGEVGFAFWSQTGTNADSFLYTNAFSFSTDTATAISWYQRDSATAAGATDPAHLALRIGNDWYISSQTFSHVGTTATDWQKQTASLGSLSYFVRPQTGTALPDGGIGLTLANLPAGQTVNAFGFWWDGPKSATSRFDESRSCRCPVRSG